MPDKSDKLMKIVIKNQKDLEKHLRRARESISFLSLSPALHDEIPELDKIYDYLQELLDHYT